MPVVTTLSAQEVKTRAVALGFNLVGITRAAPSPQLSAYFRWIDAGMHGTMGYMARPDRQARYGDGLVGRRPGRRSSPLRDWVGRRWSAVPPPNAAQAEAVSTRTDRWFSPARGTILSVWYNPV